ncbi:hypothetical protein G6M16_024370 (plasmid) [Agrobacterium tumefaciens]|nr:hypothetical protein G6M16_024370 [Agrobacterium tumefaciens]
MPVGLIARASSGIATFHERCLTEAAPISCPGDRLDALAALLGAAHGVNIEVTTADLTDATHSAGHATKQRSCMLSNAPNDA